MQIAESAIRARVAFASVGQSRSMVVSVAGGDAIVVPFDGWVTMPRDKGLGRSAAVGPDLVRERKKGP